MSQKTALITGGGSGIGAGIARAFAEAGFKVAISGRRAEVLEQVAASTEHEILCHAADVADRESVAGLFAWAAENLGPIELTGVVEGSLGPGKFDITDTPPLIGRFDPETLQFVRGWDRYGKLALAPTRRCKRRESHRLRQTLSDSPQRQEFCGLTAPPESLACEPHKKWQAGAGHLASVAQ